MDTDKKEWIAQIAQRLFTERSFGVDFLPAAQNSKTVSRADKRQALESLELEFRNCAICELSRTRTHVVLGEGNPEARLMFVGEAPGFEEDRQGRPFVGAAGQLLTKIILAMKLRREDVYIANCLKCRPPGNRNPLPAEIAACRPILARQIEIIRPEIVCALGKFAAQTLLETTEPITRLRGRFFELPGGSRLLPTFHPAYLLRNPADKKLVWEDMQKIMRAIGIS
ncbi:MAG: uracil-DNA glycosylase [Candidatus Omnitrophica bacterium]|nr:uracil-DNA glycosylase [Candidatus Omnitrophota bacterium]